MSDIPSIFQKIKNLAGTAKDVAAHLIETGEMLDREAAKARLAICKPCPSRDGNTCTECGCYLPAKTKLAAAHCDLYKWPGDQDKKES